MAARDEERYHATSRANSSVGLPHRSSHDSSLEESGFELVVPLSFRRWSGRPRHDLDQRDRRARPFLGGTEGSNPACSSGESMQTRSALAGLIPIPSAFSSRIPR